MIIFDITKQFIAVGAYISYYFKHVKTYYLLLTKSNYFIQPLRLNY